MWRDTIISWRSAAVSFFNNELPEKSRQHLRHHYKQHYKQHAHNADVPFKLRLHGAINYYPPFASIAKGEVFDLLYVCLFVCLFVCSSTISRQPTGRFTPKFACGRTLVPDVSSPLLGVGGPRRAEKGQMKFSLLWESMGNFCILAVFERYLSNDCTDPHQILFM